MLRHWAPGPVLGQIRASLAVEAVPQKMLADPVLATQEGGSQTEEEMARSWWVEQG